jgi:hypothetical protein
MSIADYLNSNVIPYPVWGTTQAFDAANQWHTIFQNSPVSLTSFLPIGCPNNVKSIVILNLIAAAPIILFVGTYADFGATGPSFALIGAGKILIPGNSSFTMDVGVEGTRGQIGMGEVMAGGSNSKLNFFLATQSAPTGAPQLSITLITTRGFLGG